MIDLELDNMKKYLEYIDKSLIEHIEKAVNKSEVKGFKEVVKESWRIVADALWTFRYASKLDLENIKEDIILSIYAAVVYKTVDSVEKATIVKRAAKVLGGGSFENTVRKAITRAEDFFDNYLDYMNIWREYANTYEWDYFKSIVKFRNLEDDKKIKVFDEYDFYVFLEQKDKWLFNYNYRETGMRISDWYVGVRSISKELQKKPMDREKPAKDILNLFLFEQIFSMSSFITMVQFWMKMTCSDFYSLNSGQREQEMFLVSCMAGLPKVIIEKYVGRLIYAYELSQKEMFLKPLHSEVYHIYLLKLYIYPLCRTLLYHTLELECLKLDGKISTTTIEKFIKEYIEDIKNSERILQLYDWRDCNNVFSRLRYPISYNEKPNAKSVKLLTEKARNNIPIESFGVNFTYFYLKHARERNVLEIQSIAKEEKPLTCDEKACICDRNCRDINIPNFLERKKRQAIGKLADFGNSNTDNFISFCKLNKED